jgi:hypothetical protein
MTKKQNILFLLIMIPAVIFSSCCGAQCRLDRQNAENQYTINGTLAETEAAATGMMDKEGYRPYLEHEKPFMDQEYSVVTGKLSADRPGNTFVSANMRYAIHESGKEGIARADLTKTIIIKPRVDAAGNSIVADEVGILVNMDFIARDAQGNSVDAWAKFNEEPERSMVAKKLQKFIDQSKQTGADREKQGE